MRKFAQHYKDRPITKVDRESLTTALNTIALLKGADLDFAVQFVNYR